MSKFSSPHIDDTRWETTRVILSGSVNTPSEVSISCIYCPPPADSTPKGTILLIHGYPQTSYQFRHVITPIANAGWHVYAPDYRGAGQSSKPRSGFTKVQMATDLHKMLHEHYDVEDKIHVVGHDIGGMVAHAYAATFPNGTASVTWGECPLPGTAAYDRVVKDMAYGGLWHFVFHWQADLPEQLTEGKERQYIKSFYDRLISNTSAISPADVDHYASMFAQPGAMRCGFDVYRAFHDDAEDNKRCLKQGRCSVPSMSLSGEQSFLKEIAGEMHEEMYETTENRTCRNSGHWCAEESPADFVEHVLYWANKNKGK